MAEAVKQHRAWNGDGDARGPWSRSRSAAWFALQGLNTARQRALLALLGVTIGVAAVVALVSLGKSAERKALDEFASMGTQVVTVSLTEREPEMSASRKSLTASQRTPLDGDALVAAVMAMPGVELVSEVMSLSCPESTGPQQPFHAAKPEFARILGLKLARGRFFSPLDRHDLWVVLGARLARQVGKRAGDLQPGSVLVLCGRTMRLAGVLAPMSTSDSIVPIEIDNSALLSSRAGQRVSPNALPDQLALRLKPEISPIDFAPKLSSHLAELTGREVEVTTAKKVLELRQRQAETRARFLASLSGLSLLVGSLGILNVMLMAVIERRREIGLRLAIGADDMDIALQFLFESVLLALAGGGAGIVIGLAGAAVATAIGDLPFVFSASGIVLALLISTVVGVASGLYPAVRAARLAPAEALQPA